MRSLIYPPCKDSIYDIRPYCKDNLAGTPAITADQAKAAAEAHLNAGAATRVQLDDENGKLVYSVEIGTSCSRAFRRSGGQGEQPAAPRGLRSG